MTKGRQRQIAALRSNDLARRAAAGWNDQTEAHLHQLWKEGHSARAIAGILNERYPTVFTVNAIIGKAHRLGLKPRPSPIRRRT